MEGVKTAAAFLLLGQRLVLTIEMPEKWLSGAVRVGLPGGKVEPGEMRYQAAIRECEEEVLVTPELFSAPKTFTLMDGQIVGTGVENPGPNEPAPLTRQRVTKNGWNIDGAGYVSKMHKGELAIGDVLAIVTVALDDIMNIEVQGQMSALLSVCKMVSAREGYREILAPTYAFAPTLAAVKGNREILAALTELAE